MKSVFVSLVDPVYCSPNYLSLVDEGLHCRVYSKHAASTAADFGLSYHRLRTSATKELWRALDKFCSSSRKRLQRVFQCKFL